ncbi:hypothetical protein JOQ06_027815, partial [Pogonophryne albipinna]
VWFDTQLHFGRRGKEGLRKLTPQSFVVKRDSAGTKYVTMAFNEETKNHKCHNDRERQNMRGAMFEEPGNALCPVASFEAYLSTLPESAKAFYHHPRKSVKPGDAVWYSMEPLEYKPPQCVPVAPSDHLSNNSCSPSPQLCS